MEERKKELLKIVKNDTRLIVLVDDIIQVEKELDRLRKLPKIKIKDDNTNCQKVTPSGKLYKEYLQQYINMIKLLLIQTNEDNTEESPLRAWLKARNEDI